MTDKQRNYLVSSAHLALHSIHYDIDKARRAIEKGDYLGAVSICNEQLVDLKVAADRLSRVVKENPSF